VNIACVSGGFPSSQTFTEVKVAETALAIAIELVYFFSKSHNAFIAIRTVQCSQVNAREQEFLDFFRVVAAIVKNTLEVDGVNIACVSGGFPSSQTFTEVKDICIAQMCIILRQSGIVLVGQ